MDSFLFQAFMYLTAAVVAVPVAKRLGLGSVLGYLIAGIVIGPVLGLVGAETQDLQHFAEFGVVMMLFLVGLELEPAALWQMRARLLGLGGLQVGVTTALVAGGALLIGLEWRVALAIGLIFSLSSTAIVLQTLNEKGLNATAGGRSGFSVLLFQDIAVIPMLALLPLLALSAGSGDVLPGGLNESLAAAGGEPGHGQGVALDHAPAAAAHAGEEGHGEPFSLVDGLPGWAHALVVLGAMAIVILGGHFLSRPLFRFIAAARLREVFTAAALLLVIGIALLMGLVGLSPALGTFLAGVVLATSEFRHELESDIEPFKGILLGLFFITVGAGINFEVLFASFATILGLTVGLIVLKGLVLFALTWVYRLPGRDTWLFTLSLAQAGEFGFVLLSFTTQNNVIPAPLAQTLSLVVALSMLLTPALFMLYDALSARAPEASDGRESDDIDEVGKVIIAGHGRFGQVANRLLLSSGYSTVVLDHRSELIDNMRKFGTRSFYGDATRPDLLHAAGLPDAKVLIVAIDDADRAIDIVAHARRERPDLHIVARAMDRHHVYSLYRAGANDIVRELFDSSVRAGRYALQALGMHPYSAEKQARTYVKQDRAHLKQLAPLWDPSIPATENEPYVALAKQLSQTMEQVLGSADRDSHDRTERGWTPPPRGYTREVGEVD